MNAQPRFRVRLERQLRELTECTLQRALERVAHSSIALVPEYPLRPRARWGWDGAAVLPALADRLAGSSDGYEAAIAAATGLAEWARGIPRASASPGEPCWENDWWGTVDALVQCAYLKSRNPSLYVEIGSGYSTLFARRAIADFELRTRLVSVDPEPREAVDDVCDEVIRRPFEDVSTEVAARLQPGDMVLIDGSHASLMNTDATVFFLELLPALPTGVLVGIDDVFLPWDYPPSWARRPYAEQYLLAAFLLGGAAGFTVRFPGWWVVECSSLGAPFERVWPLVENSFGRHSTSFWLEST